jgi:drug/metabolite transporter (DMT)-like permease
MTAFKTPSVPAAGPTPKVGGWTGPALCWLAMATVGTSVVASKMIGNAVEPFLATALRHALALPVLATIWVVLRLQWPRLSLRDALVLLAQAAAGSVGYSVLLIHGTRLTSAADASVVAGTLPAVAAAFSVLFLGERLRARMVAALACATAGVVMLALGGAPADALDPSLANGTARVLGIGLVLAAVGCEALFILGQKRLANPLHPVVMSTLMCAGGMSLSAVAAVPASAFMGSHFTPEALSAIAWYAWVPTVVGFLLWYAGANRSSGSQAALATVCLPLTAFLLAVLFLGEPARPAQWAGLAVVVAAVVLAARAR